MGTYINIGNAGFQSARNGEYVDKSGLIAAVNKTLYSKQRFACVTRCRRLSIAYYYARNNYVMHRELATGKGFADIVLIPRKHVESPAIVLELKYDQDADSAIRQIHRKEYPAKVSQYSGDLLLVGINYDKNLKTHQCKIETTVIEKVKR